MHYCRVICLVSSTDQIYHRAAKRSGGVINLIGRWHEANYSAIMHCFSFLFLKCSRKMSYLSDFKRQESKKHRTDRRRVTNLANPPRDLLQIIQAEDWYYFSFDYSEYITTIRLVGWLYWGFTSLKRYFSHIATCKQEVTNLWNSSGEAGNRTLDVLLCKPRA